MSNPPTNLTTITQIGVGTGNQTLIRNPELCTLQTCDLTLASFRYLPSPEANTAFAAIFGVLLFIQIVDGFKYKTWGFTAAMVGGSVLELAGYIARVLLHYHPFSNVDFVAQIYPLSIGPTLLTAGIYLTLGRVIYVFGPDCARYTPRAYLILFAGFDQISLGLVGIGGTMASYAKISVTTGLLDPSKNVMIAGLVFQVISMAVFGALCTDLYMSINRSRLLWKSEFLDLVTSTRFKLFLLSFTGATLLILIRSVYRVIELWGGFRSSLFVNDESTFLIMEGGMISVAVFLLSVSHPGYIFGQAYRDGAFSIFKKENDTLRISRPNPTDIEDAMEVGQYDDYKESLPAPPPAPYFDDYKNPVHEAPVPSNRPKPRRLPVKYSTSPFADAAATAAVPRKSYLQKSGTSFRVTFDMTGNTAQVPRVVRIDDASYVINVKGCKLDLHDVGN